MWARKPGKIIGAAWETRGVSTGGATVKVLLRPTTPPPRGTSRQNSVCVYGGLLDYAGHSMAPSMGA